MKNQLAVAAIALVTAATLACGGSNSTPEQTPPPAPATTPQTPADAAAQAAQGMQQAAQAMQQMAGQTAKAVDFEQLMAFLPEPAGWTRSKPKGEQVSMGVTMSKAEAEYQKGEASIDLDITDSSFNQLILSPFTMFLAQGYSERSSEGYSKSAPVAGNPGFEKWNNESKRGEVTVVIGNRFIVQATGRNVDNIEPVKALVQAVDFGKLAGLK